MEENIDAFEMWQIIPKTITEKTMLFCSGRNVTSNKYKFVQAFNGDCIKGTCLLYSKSGALSCAEAKGSFASY